MCFNFHLSLTLCSISAQLLSNTCWGLKAEQILNDVSAFWMIFITMWSPETPFHSQSLVVITFLHRSLHFCIYCLVFGKGLTDNSSVSLIPITQAALKHDCYSHRVSLISFEHWCSYLFGHLAGNHLKVSSSHHTGNWK